MIVGPRVAATSDVAFLPINPGNIIRDQIEKSQPRRTEEVRRVLRAHSLEGSFIAHVKDQLARTGKIRIGIIDNFNASQSSHGQNVQRRLLAAVPDYLRDRVEIVPFDISKGADRMIGEAIKAAASKDIVALSVSGGVPVVGVAGLKTSLGVAELGKEQRAEAFKVSIQRFQKHPNYPVFMKNMFGLSQVSSRIPVVTPVHNNGNTTPLTFGANTIVTSIEGRGTARTELPGMVDFYAPRLPQNDFTSQSPPYAIGQMLGLVSKEEVQALVRRRR